MKSNIEKTLSHLYEEHGPFNTIAINGILISFEKDNGCEQLNLHIYNCGDYDSYPIELDRTNEYPVVLKAEIHKNIKDKILGIITKEQE